MTDRRNYARIKIQIPVALYIDGTDREILGTIEDISESGVRISIPAQTAGIETIDAEKAVQFQFSDRYYWGTQEREDVISAFGQIMYFNGENDRIIMGCYVRSSLYQEYVTRKRVSGLLTSCPNDPHMAMNQKAGATAMC